MKIRMGYVTVVVDDRVREKIASAGERLRMRVSEMSAYVRSAGDDVETVGGRVRLLCDSAVDRVDSALARGVDRVAPPEADATEPVHAPRRPDGRPHLRAI